jgi:hypothetical protein
VQNSSSAFPRYPTAAAVSLNVGGVFPSVAISGAPPTLFSGTSARLFATVTAEDPYVNWTVDGIEGGDTTVGTVDSFGLYVAPAAAPPSGQATIRATTASGAYGKVTILIVDPPPPQPAPSVTAASDASVETARTRSSPARGRSFRAIRLTAVGGAVLVTTRSKLTGIARVRVRDGERQVGRCLVRATKHRSLTCRAPLPPFTSPANVQVVMTFRVHGKLVEVRRFKLGAAAFGGAHQHGTAP